jgi:hypothetical protein
MGGSQLNKFLLFKYISVLIFSGAIFALVTQNFMIGYSLLVLGYCLLRKSDKEK